MGRDLPKLGAEPEPKGIKGPSVHQQKIQIALSTYQSILAQAALHTARLTTTHIVTSKSHFPSTRWLGLPSCASSLSLFHLAPLVTKCRHIMNQGEKEEKERLELEEKREKVIAPAPSRVQQARPDTYSPQHDAAWPARYGARPEG